MRVHAVSDLHVDYEPNATWVTQLSLSDYRDDVLILAGDISDNLDRLRTCVDHLVRRFSRVLFVPGNHELWVIRDEHGLDSYGKFERVQKAVRECGASTEPYHHAQLSIVPLLGWYDGSFGEPGIDLKRAWADFRACRWPEGTDDAQVTRTFLAMNHYQRRSADEVILTFSHFLPRIDVMPDRIPMEYRYIYPVLGSTAIGAQVRALAPQVHVYGHSHVNRRVLLDGIVYVNNAFAYPHETRIAAKALVCVHDAG